MTIPYELSKPRQLEADYRFSKAQIASEGGDIWQNGARSAKNQDIPNLTGDRLALGVSRDKPNLLKQEHT